ncbi:hypothetical protein HDU96_005443, partial [Phlyctochytrium bullatum]
MNGANVNAKDKEGNSPLHFAVESDRLDILQVLLAKGADVDARNHERRTPLHVAAELGRRETAFLLLEAGAFVDPRDRSGKTPLHYAATVDDRMTEMLVKRGADLFAADNSGMKPLSYVLRGGYTRFAKLLVSRMAATA